MTSKHLALYSLALAAIALASAPGCGSRSALLVGSASGSGGTDVDGGAGGTGGTHIGGSPWTPDSAQATSANGSIDFEGDLPCALDLGFDATFPQTAPWVPANASFNATQVPVKGGPCGG